MSGERLFSVSVDLDGVGCYAAIHGLDAKALSERALRAVPVEAVSRLREIFEQQSIRATFFSIGNELALPGAAESIGAAAQAGHEIASHSFSHDYALSRRAQPAIEADLIEAEQAIEAACGKKPRGFRAPGYTLSAALLAALRARGYAYDSSLLPSPAYYAAKSAAIGLHALTGKRSHSILGNPAQLFGARGAHLRGGLRELPVSTLPFARVPIIGTLIGSLSEKWSARLALGAFARGSEAEHAHFNLELHGLDALDHTDCDLPALARLQPGLTTPAQIKLGRLAALLRHLGARAASCTLEEAARKLFPVSLQLVTSTAN